MDSFVEELVVDDPVIEDRGSLEEAWKVLWFWHRKILKPFIDESEIWRSRSTGEKGDQYTG